MIERLAGLIAGALIGCCAAPAHAQSCPADLTGIASQVQTPDVLAILTTPIDTIIAHDGGLDPAIATTTTRLAELQATLASLGAQDEETRQYLVDSITMFQAELSALNCRKGA